MYSWMIKFGFEFGRNGSGSVKEIKGRKDGGKVIVYHRLKELVEQVLGKEVHVLNQALLGIMIL